MMFLKRIIPPADYYRAWVIYMYNSKYSCFIYQTKEHYDNKEYLLHIREHTGKRFNIIFTQEFLIDQGLDFTINYILEVAEEQFKKLDKTKHYEN